MTRIGYWLLPQDLDLAGGGLGRRLSFRADAARRREPAGRGYGAGENLRDREHRDRRAAPQPRGRRGNGAEGLSVEHHGWRISLPAGTRLVWPALPHNPYRKDGRAGAGEGRIVLTLPFDEQHREFRLDVQLHPEHE